MNYLEILIPLFIFIFCIIYSIIFIKKYKKIQTNNNQNKQSNSFWNNKYIFDNIPSVFPTLGILCTALGITIGIFNFDSNNIANSIGNLLNGLKLAFIATMLGIICLIIFQKIIAVVQKNIDNHPDRNIEQTDEISALNQITNTLNELKKEYTEQFKNFKEINETNLKFLHNEFIDIKNQLLNASTSNNTSIENIHTILINNHTNLVNEFNNFSEILRQNNTEALVNVMTNATQQFNAQMNELINRLVQENFNELNNSVQQLNNWQVENKEQIAVLTEQYNTTITTFNTTAETLEKVTESTDKLTNDNSKLAEIIKSLSKVMNDDNKFSEITTNITNATKNITDATTAFNDTTNKLNEWVKNEKKFKEAVVILTEKLEQFKDFNSDVWVKYRKEMSDAVSIIKTTNESIKKNVDEIDKTYVERFNKTLTALDECIRRIAVENKKNINETKR